MPGCWLVTVTSVVATPPFNFHLTRPSSAFSSDLGKSYSSFTRWIFKYPRTPTLSAAPAATTCPPAVPTSPRFVTPSPSSPPSSRSTSICADPCKRGAKMQSTGRRVERVSRAAPSGHRPSGDRAQEPGADASPLPFPGTCRRWAVSLPSYSRETDTNAWQVAFVSQLSSSSKQSFIPSAQFGPHEPWAGHCA